MTHHQPLLRRRHADRGERAALACADRGEFGQARLRHAEYVALLRFVAPQLHRRQRRIVAGHAVQVDDAAYAGVVQQFGNRVGQAAGADVVEPADRVVGAQRHAAVDDLLHAPLHLRVVALHAGEIQVLGAVAGGHRTGRAAAQADQHRRAAEHDHRIARLQADLLDLDAVDRAEAAGQHDRLVVGAGQVLRLGQFEAAEIAEQVGPAEFVVERGAAERGLEHDLQRRGHARVQRARGFPRLRQGRNAQVRDAEAGQAGLGLAAAAGGTLVADLAAGAGGGARERRDRGRVVMGLDLDAERRRRHRLAAVFAAGRVRAVARGRMAFHHRRVVAVRAERVLRGLLVGVLDHPEQRAFLLLAVDAPAGVEDLVPAVLGIGLREHHQLDVGRIAAEVAEALAQVVDLVLGQGQAQPRVGRFQLVHRDALDGAARRRLEQRLRLLGAVQQRLGHRVVQQLGQRRLLQGVLRPAGQVKAGAALHPADRQAGAAQQFGGLARPRRARAQPRHHVARAGARLGHGRRVLRLQDALRGGGIHRAVSIAVDEVDVPGAGDAQTGNDGV